MNSQPIFRIGVIGYGVAKVYAAAFHSLNLYYAGFPRIELTAIATAREKSGQAARAQFGFQHVTTNYQDILKSDALDAVVIALPNHLHRAVYLDALRSNKAIFADKPLTANLDEAREVVTLAGEKQRDLHLNFEYRFSPPIQKARDLISLGRLGQIFSFRGLYQRASYLDPTRSVRWKGDAAARGGAFDDLGSHLLDMILWMVGMPTRVAARKRTLVSQRPGAGGRMDSVETEDHAWALLAYPDGTSGTIETGRMVSGAVNDISLEINGTLGSLRWSQMDANYLYFSDSTRPASESGWTQLPTLQTYPDAALPPADYPVGMMRYQIASAASFLKQTLAGEPYQVNLAQGYRVQKVLEAVHLAAQQEAWIRLEDLEDGSHSS